MKPNILLCVTGSVAAIKTPELVDSLNEVGDVRVVSTHTAFHFFDQDEINAPVLTDKDEWGEGYERSQAVLHIDLAKWTDVLIIAPLSADTLAKLAHGRCNNLLTCVVRAWNLDKPIVLAPAMNTHMWNHPATNEHLEKLESWHKDKLHIVQPVEKMLACGDVGMGGMAPIETICATVKTL